MTSLFTRRAWMTRNVTHAAGIAFARRSLLQSVSSAGGARSPDVALLTTRAAMHAERIDANTWQALAKMAVDAAHSAGAIYADARLTRTVIHQYLMHGAIDDFGASCAFWHAWEYLGVGVRVLVNGYWGFVASPYIEQTEIVRMARDAVAQAKTNSHGPHRTVDLGQVPSVIGHWETPIRIDPFVVPVEEKVDFLAYWKECANDIDVSYKDDGRGSIAMFVRREQVVATSEGSCFSQTHWESGGFIDCTAKSSPQAQFDDLDFNIPGLDMTGRGWELFLDANLPELFPKAKQDAIERARFGSKPSHVGRYTLVCDGKTMASLVDKTLGVATQLDRALGYEANASGTSFIDDPLAMVGTYQVASPLVTVTANRSEPAGLATAKWDIEGVVPNDATLVKDGVLTDFQTTREQAAWLAPYYQQHGHPVRSHGFASAFDALSLPLQMMPNLALEPSPSSMQVVDLVADVKDGILLEGCGATDVDFQARNGLLQGSMREIRNGQLGKQLQEGSVAFNTIDIWKNVLAIGGRATQGVIGQEFWSGRNNPNYKGQPAQATTYTVRAVAALIPNQPLINPRKRA